MIVKSFEDFKKNLGQLERTLADDSTEPTKDLQFAESWFAYVERNDASADETLFILKEWLPKVTKVIMARKFDWNRSNYANIIPIIEHLLTFAAKYLPEDHEGVYVALRDLLDPAQPFYAKYCSQKTDTAELDDLPALVDVPPLAYPDALTVGDYVDCLAKNNKWEFVTIEKFSDYRTEFEVQWQDGHREWLSMERDRHRLATFMSKCDGLDSTPAVTTGCTTPLPQSTGASIVDVTDCAWKDLLEVGDLVDVRDPSQVWYQACIMELKQKTVTVLDGPFSAPAKSAAITKAHPEVIDLTQPSGMVLSDSLDDLYDHNLSATATAAVISNPQTAAEPSQPIIEEPGTESSAGDSAGIANNMLIDENPIDFTDDAEHASRAGIVEEPHSAHDGNPAVPVFAAPTVTVRNLARIAFVGLPESRDEWIDLASDRIQQINTCSFGRRGKLIAVREEILHLVKLPPSQQGEIDKFAIYREGCFVLPLYIQMVNIFGLHGGFDVILEKLRLSRSKISPSPSVAAIPAAASSGSASAAEPVPGEVASKRVEAAASLTGLLNLITAVGPMHRVLTRSFLASFGLPFLELSSAILMELSLADIRETPVEAMEPALNALEQIALAHFGQNAATGKLIDPLKLEVALQSLRSPFLNRRLGGLKILSELIRRAENSRDFPSGLRVLRSMANGEEDVSFKVMPVLFHHTLRSICEKLRNDECIVHIFVGDNAHESLMSRAGPVLSAMAEQQCLESSLLRAMWTAGFVDRKSEALQCLSRVMSSLPVSDPHVHVLLKSIRSVEPAALTSSVVDIVAALAIRCRDALLTSGETANQEAELCFALSAQMEATAALEVGDAESRMDVVDDAGAGESAAGASAEAESPTQKLRSAFHTHTQALLMIWRWTSGSPGVSDAVVAACLNKIESILQLGVSFPDALRNPEFPWAMHWFRMSTLVDEAVHSVRMQASLFSAVKVLQLTVCAWPHTTAPGMSPSFPPVANLPFPLPHRGDAMVYFEANHQLIECVTTAAVRLKRHFNAEVLAQANNAAWGADVKTVSDFSSAAILPTDVEERLNKTKLPESRQGYLEQLSQLLDFLQMAVRCGDSLEIPRATIFQLWEAVIDAPVTSDEVDAIISFCHRIVTVTSVTIAGSASAGANSTSAATASTASKEAEAPRRTSVSSREVVLDAFANLLCKKTGFLQSRFFSTKAFSCAEKWFRWLNAGFAQPLKSVREADDAAHKTESNQPVELIGIDVFANIILTCHSDKVAASAVKFLTTLPQTLTHWSRNAPSAVAFRKKLLSLCMDELSSSVAAAQAGASSTAATTGGSISRALLFLDGILEESLSSTGGAVSLHGTIGRGVPVTFVVSSTTQSLKGLDGEVVLYMNETVADLFCAVAKQLQISVVETKIFRRGQAIDAKKDGDKTISQLHGLTIGEKERLVVSKHPCAKKVESDAAAMIEEDPSVEVIDTAARSPKGRTGSDLGAAETEATAALPVLVLSQTPEYFHLLFNLLQSSTGEVCDRVWSLITRIPTSSAVLNQWVSLECDSVAGLLVAADAHSAGKLSTLLYNLQVIEMLMQPAVSAADLEVQCRYIRDIDHALLASFAERFITKQGFAALCKALQWVSEATQTFLAQSAGADLPGVTPHLLQATSALITKMLRGFLVRLCAHQSDAHKATIEGVLSDLKLSEGILKDVSKLYYQDSIAKAGEEPVILGPAPAPLPAAAPTEVKTVAAAESAPPAASSLDAEWGWRIAASIEVVAALCDPLGTPLNTLEATVVQQMVLMRKLCDHCFFHAPVSADKTVTTAKLAKRIDLLGSQDHLLVLWTAAALTCSEADGPGADATKIVNELVLGNASTGDRPGVVSAVTYNDGANFFMECVLYFVHWMSRHYAAGTTAASASTAAQEPSETSRTAPSPIDNFVSAIIINVLRLRPSLTELIESAATDKSHYKPLFDLAAGLFNRPDAARLTLPSDVCATTCEQILSELRTVAQRLRAAADKADGPSAASSAQQAYPHLEGTVMLFVALCINRGADQGAGLLQDDSVLDFILYECLGLVGLSKCGTPIVCSDDTPRKHMYLLLKELVGRSAQRAQSISHTLAALHREVPPPAAWDYRPQWETRSSTGYVGLRNLGSTCYMNSLLQVLFMNHAVREYILNEIHFDTQSEEALRNNLACQLQKIFFALKHSQKRFFSPTDWTFAFKDETGSKPMDVMIQQDAQEFLQLLSERFERCIQEHQQTAGGNAASVDILHRTFGGLICNQMFKTNSDNSPITAAKREIREQNEGFMCISLDVKGCENLEKSLSKFVEGEQISGYQWEEGQPRENITKRQCIAKLPDALIFHLKRFELNFDTFRREKVNDAFAFPLRVNMHPYTKAGLEVAESGATSAEDDVSEYEFELSGVIVHTGTTESGHYFAYIKEAAPGCTEAQTARWCEFNDSEVSGFSIANLEKECFGGMCKTHDVYSGGTTIVTHETVNPKSAYMLIYNRVKPCTAVASKALDADPPVVAIGSVIEKFKAQIELENAHQSLSTRILNEQHLTFANALLEALHRHASDQGALLSSEQLSEYVEFVTQYVAHTAHSSILRVACENIHKYLAGHKALALKNASVRNAVGSPLPVVPSASQSRSFGTVAAPPMSSPSYAKRPPTPPAASEGNKENETPLPPPPPMDAPGSPTVAAASSAAASSAATAADAHAEVCEVPAPPVSDLILTQWLRNVDSELAGLYAPKEEVRKSVAELTARVVEIAFLQHGKEVFSDIALDMNTGLLSTSFGAGMLAVAALASTAASVFNTPGKSQNNMFTIPEDTEMTIAEPVEMDEDLLLAIKMSQEMNPGEVSPVPTTASIAVPSGDNETARPPSPVDVSEVPASGPTVTAGPPVGPQVPVPTPAHLLAPNLLLALTNDTRMQLIAENWRRSQSVLWLLLEFARLGSAPRQFLLKRETVAQLVDIILGDQCPLSGMVYAVGSRRRAPSSYVTIVPGKDGSLPFVARNIPDWTHLVELLSLLVCQSNSLQLAQSMGEISFQCVQVKTLYSTLLRQARYITAALPMIVHLSFENKPISDMIGEAFCEELSLSNHDSTAHIFQAMERFLNINDTLSYQRNFQLFGGGDFNLMETMNISKDQPAKQRLVCVFIRSFLALIETSPTLRSVVSAPQSKVNNWAPWMLKFCFRFTNKCNKEQAECAVPIADADKQKLNAAIERVQDKLAKDASTVSPARTKKPTGAGKDSVSFGPAESPLLSKGPYMRVFGEDAETESTQTWVQRAERTSQMLHALLTRLGASPDALLPVDTFDEEVVSTNNTVTTSAGASSGNGTFAAGPFSAPSAAAVHPMPLAQSKATQGGDSVGFPQFADGMSDEELAQLLQDGALGTEMD